MVVVHYRTDALRPRLDAIVATHDSGASDVKFHFLFVNAVSTPTQNMENITTFQGYHFTFHSLLSCIHSGAAWHHRLLP